MENLPTVHYLWLAPELWSTTPELLEIWRDLYKLQYNKCSDGIEEDRIDRMYKPEEMFAVWQSTHRHWSVRVMYRYLKNFLARRLEWCVVMANAWRGDEYCQHRLEWCKKHVTALDRECDVYERDYPKGAGIELQLL